MKNIVSRYFNKVNNKANEDDMHKGYRMHEIFQLLFKNT